MYTEYTSLPARRIEPAHASYDEWQGLFKVICPIMLSMIAEEDKLAYRACQPDATDAELIQLVEMSEQIESLQLLLAYFAEPEPFFTRNLNRKFYKHWQ